MILYAETSAVLAWLLDEAAAPPVEAALSSAERVITSELTVLEVERVLVRAVALGHLSPGQAATSRESLVRVADYWSVQRLRRSILDRAGRPFPFEPVRTLDALHLASALDARSGLPEIALLSLDGRLRDNAKAMGLRVAPG